MADEPRHLTAFLMLQIVEGELGLDSIRAVAAGHVERCERCAAIYRRHLEAVARRREGSGGDYGAAFARALEAAEELARRLDAERPGAEADLRRLLRLRPRSRAALIARDEGRFRSPVLADLVLAACREAVRRDPREAHSLAAVAGAVSERVPAEVYGGAFVERLALRALAHRANALRAGGDLARAEALWEQVLGWVELAPPGDRETEAELASLEASLRLDQRRLDQADRLLRRAQRLYRALGNEEGQARVILQRGIVAHHRPDPAGAAAHCGEAAALFARVGSPALETSARLNLAVALCDLGRFDEASAEVARQRTAYAEPAHPEIAHRLAWIDGRIARGRGDAAAAEAHLLAARNGYLAADNPFNAALIALDLAEVYQAEGRTAAVKRIAEATVGVFTAGGVHREALRAASLFRDAAIAERLTAGLLAHLRAWFAQARRNPRLPFASPG